MKPLHIVEQYANAVYDVVDKDRLLKLLRKQPGKYFIPISETPSVLNSVTRSKLNKQQADDIQEDLHGKESFKLTANLLLAWKLNGKILTIPEPVLEGFMQSKKNELYSEEQFSVPNTIFDVFPHWGNCVKVGRGIKINLHHSDPKEEKYREDIHINFMVDHIVYGIRMHEGVRRLYYICFITRNPDSLFGPGEGSREYQITGYYEINPTEYRNVSHVCYKDDELVDPNTSQYNAVIMNSLNQTVIDIIMYVATMNKHRPDPYNNDKSIPKRLGNIYHFPIPAVKELMLGESELKEVNEAKETKQGSSKSKLTTHVRRGYWRRQWYGSRSIPEERTMELIYIPPCIVRGFNEEPLSKTKE